jgi:hypothetical protein
LAESSNKSLIRTIKKLLQENKKAWNTKLVFALWANRVSTKKSIGTSPFQLVYGVDAIFLASLAMPIMKYVQEEDSEPNPIQRRINQLIEVHQEREALCEKVQIYQDKVKQVFDKRAKVNSFKLGDMVLKWDASMRIRESPTNLTNYGKVLFQSLPLQEGMHFSSRIQKVIE